ncbi:hypothetical protein DSM112329_02547 [Paraconexibacter sp. AEG42_29]|uniref:HTH tetR-type domain-containing protein n=1 Tax=Paraconexibacter sp. AEG42_29 TaxID=2997339 RepID=A0AAU7AVH1_9ACTN
MGLRERKREQTRSALADAALDLFSERGYDATTIADIAERAGVSPRTFFSHYPSKEQVMFPDDELLFSTLEIALAERPEGQQTLDALRTWLVSMLGVMDLEAEAGRKQLQRDVVAGTPVLLAHQRHLLARFEVLIRESVAADLGETADDLRPRLVAATAAAALDATHPVDNAVYELPEILARLDLALAFLRGGLAALDDG